MDDFALLVQVLSLVRADGDGPIASYVTVEEGECIATGDNACALIVQQCRRVPLQDSDAVTEILQGQTSGQATQGSSDLYIHIHIHALVSLCVHDPWVRKA